MQILPKGDKGIRRGGMRWGKNIGRVRVAHKDRKSELRGVGLVNFDWCGPPSVSNQRPVPLTVPTR